VGPEVAVGESVLEDDIPQVELAIANERLDRAGPPFAAERPKRPQWHDGRPTLDFLTGNEVAHHGVETANGNLWPFLEAGSSHLELTHVPLRLEGKSSNVIREVHRGEVRVAMVERAFIEVEEDRRGVGGGRIVLGGLHGGP